MLNTAIILFVVAALFGSIILRAILKNNPTPKSAVFIHGPIAALGLILVILYYMEGHKDGLLFASIAIFVLAALGGLTLFTIDMSKKPLPKALAIIHPLAAATALVMLIVYAMR